jgi:hypothetical protein
MKSLRLLPLAFLLGCPGTDEPEPEPDPIELGRDPFCSPFNIGLDCGTPFPSVFHTRPDPTSATGVRLNYSAEMVVSPDGPLPVDPAMFNRYDGMSVTAPLLVNLRGDVHPDQLYGLGEEAASVADDAPVLLMHSDTGERVPLMVEMDRNNRDLSGYFGRYALILRPVAPLEPGARYIAALSTALRDVDGDPFPSPPAMDALRDGVITTDAWLEAERQRYEDVVFPRLQQAGWAREDILMAWETQVASDEQSLGPILSMKEAAEADLPNGVPFEVTDVQIEPNERVAVIVQGRFQPPNFLVDNELQYSDDAYSVALQDGERPAYEFTMAVPRDLPADASVPLVVIGHGIFGRGRQYISGGVSEAVQRTAQQAGIVVIATDFVGLSGGDASLIIDEVLPDIARIRVVTDRLAQSLINNLAMVELARSELQFLPELGRSEANPLLDDRLYYYGVSLGGIQGTSFVGLHDDVSRAVWAVPGAGWSHMIQRSWHFAEMELVLDLLYPDPLSQLVFITALQNDFDAADPVNLSRRLRQREGFVGVVQEAVGDCQVPNVATDVLVRAMGAEHLEAAPRPVWGVPTTTGPATEGLLFTQIVLPDALDGYVPPDENTIPVENNGTHSAIVTTEPALQQVLSLLVDGEVPHPCDGDCAPD